MSLAFRDSGAKKEGNHVEALSGDGKDNDRFHVSDKEEF
jgi:hypothetical protein